MDEMSKNLHSKRPDKALNVDAGFHGIRNRLRPVYEHLKERHGKLAVLQYIEKHTGIAPIVTEKWFEQDTDINSGLANKISIALNQASYQDFPTVPTKLKIPLAPKNENK